MPSNTCENDYVWSLKVSVDEGEGPDTRKVLASESVLSDPYGVQGTTVLLPCLVMLQRVSQTYKGHQISEKFDSNEEGKWNLL